MHAAVCLLRAGQPRSAGDAAKLGQFVGQFSWVTGDPIGLKGLTLAKLLKSSYKNAADSGTEISSFSREILSVG